jgi:hypothetical protein
MSAPVGVLALAAVAVVPEVVDKLTVDPKNRISSGCSPVPPAMMILPSDC